MSASRDLMDLIARYSPSYRSEMHKQAQLANVLRRVGLMRPAPAPSRNLAKILPLLLGAGALGGGAYLFKDQIGDLINQLLGRGEDGGSKTRPHEGLMGLLNPQTRLDKIRNVPESSYLEDTGKRALEFLEQPAPYIGERIEDLIEWLKSITWGGPGVQGSSPAGQNPTGPGRGQRPQEELPPAW